MKSGLAKNMVGSLRASDENDTQMRNEKFSNWISTWPNFSVGELGASGIRGVRED
jgi:hypothetical protein